MSSCKHIYAYLRAYEVDKLYVLNASEISRASSPSPHLCPGAHLCRSSDVKSIPSPQGLCTCCTLPRSIADRHSVTSCIYSGQCSNVISSERLSSTSLSKNSTLTDPMPAFLDNTKLRLVPRVPSS